MVRLVVLKEIHDNFLNARFLAACAVSLVLVVSSIAVLTRSHEEQVRDYRSRVQEQDDFIDRYGHLNRIGWMAVQHREPPHLQVLASGIDPEAGQENFISNPLPVLFSRLDFVSIVTVILSLVAVIFSYNSISGEREAGLLRQMLASGVSRGTLFSGKFAGGLISLIIPVTVSVIAGMLVLALEPGVQLRGVDFAVFGVLLAASWLYLSAVYGIGLLFSSRSATSGQALLKSLFAWVVVVLVIPNISPFLSAALAPIPSATRVHQEIFQLEDTERDILLSRRTREMTDAKYADLRELLSLSQKDIQAKLKADPALNTRFTLFVQDREELNRTVNREQQVKAEKIGQDFQQRSVQQENLARAFTSASPFSNFVFIATDLAETGLEADAHWGRQASDYGATLRAFAEARYKKEMADNPAYSFNDYLDLRERPRFQYAPASLMQRVEPDLVQWLILLIVNVIVFVIGYASFQHYDVR
jgi:ABC-type transport system involved in multi-copper enzyme maturation permease subunit